MSVIEFPGSQKRNAKVVSNSRVESSLAPWRGHAYPRRNSRNPLRALLRSTETAMVELNKIDYQLSPREIEQVRQGVEAARALADELARIAADRGIT